MKKLLTAFLAALALTAAAEYNSDAAIAASIRDVVVRQQWPWATTVTATFRVSGLESGDVVDVSLAGRAGGEAIDIPAAAVKGVRTGLGNGEYTLSFDPADVPGLVRRRSVANFQAVVTATRSSVDMSERLYMVVDLEATTPETAVSYLTRGDILSGAYGSFEREPNWIRNTSVLDDCLIWTGVTNDVAYKTTKLVLRRVPAGTFNMGAASGELGYVSTESREDYHPVTLTAGYWIAVFETTQRQYKLLMDEANPSVVKGDARPVENVSYDEIRGATAGAGWPGSADVDAMAFMGRLRAKTGLAFDLPTEAQWEYACRAGTASALNSGADLTDETTCPNLAELGRYKSNQDDGRGGSTSRHAEVGAYRPNAWGLYDMHGNVFEWCRD